MGVAVCVDCSRSPKNLCATKILKLMIHKKLEFFFFLLGGLLVPGTEHRLRVFHSKRNECLVRELRERARCLFFVRVCRPCMMKCTGQSQNNSSNSGDDAPCVVVRATRGCMRHGMKSARGGQKKTLLRSKLACD